MSLLKKIEVKIQKLVELRKVFDFFEPKKLAGLEKEIKDQISQ